MYIWYEKFNKILAVREDLKGKHKEHCMCYNCKRFFQEDKCKIASALYEFDCTHGVTTPVWECIDFINVV